jgi:SAM-dependent methyltransferase
MSAFEFYADFYDRLYPDKDYAAEVAYVERLIRDHGVAEKSSILDLGCGTGRHIVELACRGYSVHGIDRSARMVKLAEARKSSLPAEVAKRVELSVGDVREIRLETEFDVVMALFHVASYQVSNDDFKRFLDTARSHLRPGGILIIDFWYGPAVLLQQPEVRVKRAETEADWLVRVAEPDPDYENNIVTVKYELIHGVKETGQVTRINENHKMRFFFLPEVRLFAKQAGIDVVSANDWMETTSPTAGSWSVCVVGTR